MKHNISYNASDCEAKLSRIIYPDSAIAKKTSCGRTKAEAIVTDVLGPKSVQQIVNDLTSDNCMMPTEFAIGTDASNVKNRKMFPVCLQYFTVESGINTKLLDFVELNDEHSEAVAKMMLKSLSENNLDIKHVSSYAADNASVNYGVRQSVFTELKKENGSILKANCNAHVTHNTLKKAADALKCDIETVITSVYSHFSVSANRRIQLIDFFEFVDAEYHELLRHVPTRWLSLGPAIDRLLDSWVPVVSYFVSLGEECPKRVKEKLGISDDDHDCYGTGVQRTKAYLYFAQSLCTIFESCVREIEKNDFTLCELYPKMEQLRGKIESRLRDNFFSAGANKILSAAEFADIANAVENNFRSALQVSLDYIDKWFFSSSSLALELHKVSLKTVPEFVNLTNACDLMGLMVSVDLDSLYDEFSQTREILSKVVTDSKSQTLSASARWQAYFKACKECGVTPRYMFKIISAVLSIPGSNAFAERTFSMMNAKWRADRNRALVQLIKAELQVSLNIQMKCREFYDYALADHKLLTAAASGQKYYWRKVDTHVNSQSAAAYDETGGDDD